VWSDDLMVVPRGWVGAGIEECVGLRTSAVHCEVLLCSTGSSVCWDDDAAGCNRNVNVR